jgi:dUTP pyrophosphatase
MKIPTRRFDKTVPLPMYEDGAAGFDFISREAVTIKPKEIKIIPSNLALAIPKGYVLLIVPRSSTASRHGLTMPNSIGVIDPFNDAEDNEHFILLYNFTNKAVKIKKGDQIAQGILLKYEKAQFDEKMKLAPARKGRRK